MVAHTEKGLKTIMNALSKTEKEYDMKIYLKKTKVMRVCRNESKREKKTFKYYIRKEKAMAWTHLKGRKFCEKSYKRASGRKERKAMYHGARRYQSR